MVNENNFKLAIWQITNKCNYNCSYCTIPKKTEQSNNYKETIKKLSKIEETWNLVLTGGEPFFCRNLKNIVSDIIRKTKHNLTIVTNLSAPINRIVEIIEIAKERLKNLELSLHLEYTSPESFLEKILEIKNYSDKYGTEISVKCVAIKKDFQKRAEIAELFSEKGINFTLLPDKYHFGDPSYYSWKEKKIIKKFGQNFGLSSICLQNKLCDAGRRFFVIDEKGNAYRCHSEVSFQPFRKSIGKEEDEEFTLYNSPKKCPYPICVCETPYCLGMVYGTRPIKRSGNEICIFMKSLPDRTMGKIGIFLKKLNPKLYHKLKRMKDGK